MPSVLIRDLPDDVHAALQQRAKREGQSLQQYVVGELARITRRPTLNEMMDRIEQRAGGEVGLSQAVEDLSDVRSRQ